MQGAPCLVEVAPAVWLIAIQPAWWARSALTASNGLPCRYLEFQGNPTMLLVIANEGPSIASTNHRETEMPNVGCAF